MPEFDAAPSSVSLPEPPVQTSRLATDDERRYLRRFNRLRLLRYLMFLSHFAVAGAVVGGVLWLAAEVLLGGDPVPGVIMLVLTGLALSVVSWQWGPALLGVLRMRPMLRIPTEVEVVCFQDTLATVAHPTGYAQNIFTSLLRGRLLELPSHWEEGLIENGFLPRRTMAFEVAQLPGASGGVLRLPMLRRITRDRIDAILPDLGAFVLRLDDRSIDREMRARLPLMRAQYPMAALAFGAGVIGLFVCLGCWVYLEDRSEAVDRLEREITRIEQRYGGGGTLSVPDLAGRGFGPLRPDREFGDKVLHAGPLSLRKVSLWRGEVPFYLTDAETEAVARIAAVFPDAIPGSDPAGSDLITAYRAQLSGRASALAATAPWLPDAVAALSDALVERQMRALPYGNAADRSFLAAVLPRPTVLAPRSGSPYLQGAGMSCSMKDVLCGQRSEAMGFETPIFVGWRDGLTLRDGEDLTRLDEARKELSALQAETWPFYAVAACIFSVLVPLSLFASWYLARRRIRLWRQGT